MKITNYIKLREWILIILNIIVIFFRVYFEVKIIDLTSDLLSLIKSSSFDEIKTNSLYLICYSFIVLLLALVSSFLVSFASSKVIEKLRQDTFNKILYLPLEKANSIGVSGLVNRTNNDIMQIQKGLQMFLKICFLSPITAIYSIIKIASYGYTITLSNIIAVILVFLIFIASFFLTKPLAFKIEEGFDALNQTSNSTINGIKIIRAYNAQNYQKNKLDVINKDLSKTNRLYQNLMWLNNPLMNFIFNALTLFIYWYGSYLVSLNQLEYINLVSFSRYGANILTSTMLLSTFLTILPRSLTSLKRIKEVFKIESIQNVQESKSQPISKGEIEFKNVSFHYEGNHHDTIKDVSFSVRKGETIAIIGQTGCGKTTIVNLLINLLKPSQGEILIDGINIDDYNKKDLSDKISYVPQKTLLFSDTIKNNLLYGTKDISENDIAKAIDIVSLDFINDENDLEKVLSQGGENLSGGQRQRLSIARAILKKSEFLILDDCFSALDFKTEKKIRNNLKKEFEGTTKLIVAQRISTVMDADTILVLENGKITSSGKHEYLLKNSALYKEIYDMQIGDKL